MNEKQGIRSKIKTILWSFKTAWHINKFSMLGWYTLSALLAILPAIALKYNQQTLAILSGFLAGENYVFADVISAIIKLGGIMVLSGLSARVNIDLVYIMMYDSYFVGMYEMTMDNIQRIEMTELLKKDVNDSWDYCILYAGSLVDFVSGACSVIAKIVSIVSLLVVAFTTSQFVFIVSLIYVLGIFTLNLMFSKKTRRQTQEEFQESRIIEYYEKFAENRGMAKETRVYENTDEIVKQWEKPYMKLQRMYAKRAFAGEVRDLISGAGFYAFLIIAIGMSLSGLLSGVMKPDVFLIIFTLCLNIYTAVSGLAGLVYKFDAGLSGLEKQRLFFEIAEDEDDDTNKADTAADEGTVFEVEHLNFSYPSGVAAIRDISFTVKRGETVALVGENGSGKSTLVKLLLNMYKPQSGSIRVFGRGYDEYKKDFLRSKIGVIFQNFHIFHLTMRENIGAGRVEDMWDDGKINDAIKKGGADKVVKKLKNGVETLLGNFMDKSGTELSGGEKQRVGAARAHMDNRDVLIFDEPASMLDPIAEMEQFMEIRNMLHGRTAILISHRIGFARIADKIIMLKDGKIAEMGTHNELMAQNGAYAEFFREQAQWYDTANVAERVEA